MSWIQQYKRSAIIVGATLALPLALAFYAMLELWQQGQIYQEEIDRFEPRIARLQGMVQSEVQLTSSVAQAQQMLAELIYSGDEEISASLQQDILELVTFAGMQVANSRILPSTQLEDFEKIGLRITATGSMAALDATLSELGELKPRVLIESMTIEPNRQVTGRPELSQQAVTVTFVAVSLRVAP